ncbi:opsin, ultraviolet-sensitive [Pieris rapae]|uniref:opsin, ultraviolet-sensitive n=1 Tax=Pieris rapae TaxID=64459 RepID=UPI001E27B143|nr:opsin, ultraviolet-sensitive [Pieris rapae]
MMQITKIILILIPIIVPCDNSVTNELDIKCVKKSVLTKVYCTNLVRYVDNFKLWKKRKRLTSIFDELKIRIKRRAMDYEYVLDVKSTPVARGDLGSSSDILVTFKRNWPLALWRRYLFTDDYLLLINPHWLKFGPPEPGMQYLLGGLYVTMAVVGCSGNAVVIIMYFRCRSLRTPGNILVANLALSDFIMLAKTPIFIFNSFNLGPALGKTGCVFYGFVGGLSGTTSIATLTAIALDRYWAVVYPLQPLRALTAIRARLFAIGAWIYAAIFSIIPALDIGYGHYVPEGFLTSCSFDYLTDELPPRYFIFVFFCAAWFFPLCIICFCYTRILRIVVGSRNMNNKNQPEKMSSRHVKEQTKRKAEIKLAGLVIAVIALFFISWTPYAIVTLLGIFGQKDVITPGVSMIPALFCKTAACIDPFIYIITHPKFRKELQKMLFKDKSRRMTGTFKSVAYSMETTKMNRISRDLSDTDVEVIEMKDIPYHNDANGHHIQTVSSKVSKRQDSQKSVGSVSMKSIEAGVVSPPSWYTKPQFSRAKSFSRMSNKSSC